MAAKHPAPESISEEYYQISEPILSSFPKYRPPLDLFVFNSAIMQLISFSRKGDRLSNEQVAEAQRLCGEGELFVSRADHPVYSKHIVKQLDLVLVDRNLKEAEIADICLDALEQRLPEFFDQPVKPVFERLYADLMVITEYLWLDRHRIRLFTRRLFRGDHTLSRHSINTWIAGLWLFITVKDAELRRKDFDQAALALLLHDLGMARVPAFIIGKTTPLKPEEKEKIPPHVLNGYKTLHKLDQTFDLMRQAALEHHERLDGSGYPQRSREISAFGRLTAVADAFAAMIQKRPYADAQTPLTAAQALAAEKSRFDLSCTGQLLAGILDGVFKEGKS